MYTHPQVMAGRMKKSQTNKLKNCFEILIMYITLIIIFITMIITIVEDTSTYLSSFSYGSRQVIYIRSKVMKFHHL